MITIKSKGNFKKANNFFERLLELGNMGFLNKYGEKGVEALRAATPKDTGKTADSWTYSIERSSGHVALIWSNSNVNDGVNIAVILQYGHGTGTGGYVEGIDYINPAMKPLFTDIADKAWRELIQ